MNARERWWVLAPALAVSAWLALFGDKSPAGAGISQSTWEALPMRSAVPAPVAPSQEHHPIAREVLFPPETVGASKERDLFVARSWMPPRPPVAVVVPEAPIAPPVPYTVVGKKQEAGTWEVYLTRGPSTFIARAGETLEGAYRVDAIAPPTLTLTYLPLGQAQDVPIGESR